MIISEISGLFVPLMQQIDNVHTRHNGIIYASIADWITNGIKDGKKEDKRTYVGTLSALPQA
jgi:hypothetical protein